MSKERIPGAGRIRWRRFAAAAVPAVAVAFGIVALEGQGALAASFHVSGIPATITADKMVGTGFAQYGWIDGANGNPGATPPIPSFIPVAATGLKQATLYNLCQSVTIPLPVIGPVSMVIKAGADPNHPVTATNLVIDMTKMSGNAEFGNIQIGNDASELTKGPATAKGPQNMYGQQADSLTVTDLKQTAYATSAGTFTLNGMNLELKSGTFTCPLP